MFKFAVCVNLKIPEIEQVGKNTKDGHRTLNKWPQRWDPTNPGYSYDKFSKIININKTD